MERLDAAISRMETATKGLNLTAAEQKTIKWVCGWEPSTVENVASVIEKARAADCSDGLTRKDLLTMWGYLQFLKDEYERKARETAARGDDLGRKLTADYMQWAVAVTALQRKIDKEANRKA